MKPKEDIKIMGEEVDVGKAVTFWQKNRNKIYGVILFAVGLFGGNIDRVEGWLPKFTSESVYEKVQVQVEDLENRVTVIETTLDKPTTDIIRMQ